MKHRNTEREPRARPLVEREDDDRRVLFDFEIEFSKGGGLQGQGFRLDIAGEDVDDEVLARLLVSDLRLLMVGRVRILRKAIIREPHKRRPAQPCRRP